MNSQSRGDDRDRRVLVLAPAGKDAPLARDVLARFGIAAVACSDMAQLCAELTRGAGTLIVTEEALIPTGLDRLAACLGQQPPWSDVPIIAFLAGSGSRASLDRLAALGNVTILERPIHIPALISTVTAALRARLRQYEVRDLMRELRDANRAKDDFVAMVSHELRTPLTVIRGTARTLMLKNFEIDRLMKAATLIDRNAEVLSRLVDDLLDFSRLRKRRFQLNVSTVSLADVIEASLATVRTSAEVKRIRLVADLAPAPATVRGDAVRLQQILGNLLTNAVKFTPAQGTVTLRLRVGGTLAMITVHDTGEGIDPELLPYVFEPFRQGRSGRHGGLGLGLAIVRQFVELHGGVISVHSDGPGRGAEFVVRLPLHTTSAEAAGEPLADSLPG